MTDQLLILAESGAAASEGLSAPVIGIGTFLILMALLGLTWLTGGAQQRKRDTTSRMDPDR
ncbi:hypothetical protein [Brachybacterium sp. UNK5269]|uniref:hypothetical protein n=1 Tax=Brachybacterium sp. UNK5269 TaxID=3408576 RepID=UPI003BAE609B